MHKGHPKGLYMLFFVEMWERFGYYGMRALLVLYMTKSLMFSTAKASSVYGWYTGLVYLSPLIGGYVADRYLGARKSVMVGAVLMALGYFAIAYPSIPLFFFALSLIIFGNGFFKPNISTMVGSLYEKHDPRRDGAFTIFYMGVNLGAFLSPLVCGTLGEKVGWDYGFATAGVGMVVGLIIYLWGHHRFLGTHCLLPASCSSRPGQVDQPLTKTEKQRIAVIFILAFFVIFFWSAFEQAGSSLTLFADRDTDRTIPFLGWLLPTTYFQALNPLLIITLAPFFARTWQTLGERKMEPSTPIKFVIGLCLLAAGFVVMSAAAAVYEKSGPVSIFWLMAVYFFHTLGELCISPVGLSMVTKLSPAKFASLLMGTWYTANFAANLLGGLFAGNYEGMDHKLFFLIPAATALGAAAILLIIHKPIKRWIHGAD